MNSKVTAVVIMIIAVSASLDCLRLVGKNGLQCRVVICGLLLTLLWAVEGTIEKVLEGNDTLVPNDRLGIKMMMIIKAYHNKKFPKVPSNHSGDDDDELPIWFGSCNIFFK